MTGSSPAGRARARARAAERPMIATSPPQPSHVTQLVNQHMGHTIVHSSGLSRRQWQHAPAAACFRDGGRSLAGLRVKNPDGLSRNPMEAAGMTG